jgi:antitoxin component HigA of HigAB toxin-antitoxin module
MSNSTGLDRITTMAPSGRPGPHRSEAAHTQEEVAMQVRRPTAALGALLLSLAVVAPAAGQEEAAPVPYLDDQGNQLGTILIRDFADPFTEFDPAAPPAEGQRYAILTTTFEAAEDQAFPTDPYQVQLLDSNGYLHFPAGVRRPPDAVVPDLQSQNLAPFDRVSGVIPYVLPADASIVRILYRGDGRRLMTLSELGDSGAVAVKEPRSISDAAGTTFGSLTLREVMDPFVDFDPNGPPPEGLRYVVLDVAFDAAEDQALYANPAAVAVVGSDSLVYYPTWVPRPQPFLLQNLESTPLSPSDRVSGIVGYAIPQDVQVDSVVYNSESNRFLTIADL